MLCVRERRSRWCAHGRGTAAGLQVFQGSHEAQLRPLTLLVGENSTGKTSLMALIRALWEIAYRHSIPNFKEEPFDLGSFDDMAHRTDEAQANSLLAGSRLVGSKLEGTRPSRSTRYSRVQHCADADRKGGVQGRREHEGHCQAEGRRRLAERRGRRCASREVVEVRP